MTQKSAAIMVPMDVKYHAAWLSWVAATTTCLNALGVKCDQVDVAGVSGYAFNLGINKTLCPSGPTWFDWGMLQWGILTLGRTVAVYQTGECYVPQNRDDRNNAQAKTAFEFAKREIEEGRPCVIWGAYVPEFAVVVGIEGNSYIVKSYREFSKEPQPPVPYNELNAPGGIYVLAFPDTGKYDVKLQDKFALENAVRFFNQPSFILHYGKEGYKYWINELEAGNAGSFGISYNTACYHEGRIFAKEFLKRVAGRNSFAKDELMKASKLYEEAENEFKTLAKLFPFPGEQGKNITDKDVIKQAVKALKKAKKSECEAMDIVDEVAKMDWPK